MCLCVSQLFSTEERRAAVQYRVTVHGVPGPEPFTVVGVSERTTARQLLHNVSEHCIFSLHHILYLLYLHILHIWATPLYLKLLWECIFEGGEVKMIWIFEIHFSKVTETI